MKGLNKCSMKNFGEEDNIDNGMGMDYAVVSDEEEKIV